MQIAEAHVPTRPLRAPRGSEWLKKVRADLRNRAAATPNSSSRRSGRKAPVYSPEGMRLARDASFVHASKRNCCTPTRNKTA